MGVNDLKEGSGTAVSLEDFNVAVFRIDGKFYAMDNECLHRGGPLGEGQLKGHTVVCPWHGWKYDVATGALELIRTLRVGTYSLEIRGDEVYIGIPENGGGE